MIQEDVMIVGSFFGGGGADSGYLVMCVCVCGGGGGGVGNGKGDAADPEGLLRFQNA
jgi:hypothetical protein